jgi:hypothetical protein
LSLHLNLAPSALRVNRDLINESHASFAQILTLQIHPANHFTNSWPILLVSIDEYP